MNRTERLLAMVQMLRRHRHPVTADAIAREFTVSVRTVYRDVIDLQATGVPVRGEAGIGYVLDPGFDLPPLMFTADELEALMLGARFVRERGDPGLVRAAEDATAKILAVLPPALKPVFADASVFAPNYREPLHDRIDLAVVRRALRAGRKLEIAYRDLQDRPSERIIWPIAVGYMEASRMVVAWCELRQGFRHFRADRIERMTELDLRYPARRSVLLKSWQAEMAAERSRYDATSQKSPPAP
ncbi:helix-turn-helix transcriptional regulator [Prosthecodimorpha staleyi]|uniref:YafY family transcriptional regulator n=1 Tax=Prosthecodimorpha staleyi TaxID=2840188 RepID=A0A947CZE4_9HYPH|nr:YafY family protein [Prosthecodimorpha staleyi]MBT9287935.1 YafY family transcriptional regulator [Prosthecodimorpha staleyi]